MSAATPSPDAQPLDRLRRIGVIGAGQMGGGIAHVCALAGLDVVMTDISDEALQRGRDAIDRIAGAIRATHPDFTYQSIAEPEEVGNGGRVKWVSGRPGDAPAYAGTDFIIARDGRIAAIYLFFD